MAVRGIGVVGGFGCGNQAFHHALNTTPQGCGCPNDCVSIETSYGPYTWPIYRADDSPLQEFVPKRKLRRTNKFSRLATLAAYLALKDAADSLKTDVERTAVIIATGYGASSTTFKFLDNVILEGDSLASPTLFSNSVHSSAASNVTILLPTHGPCLTVTQFEMSGVAAVFNAHAWLQQRRVDAVLLGCVDEINDVLLYSYQNFFKNQPPENIEPFSYKRQTAIPGEGAAFLLLTREEDSDIGYGCISDVVWNKPDDTIVDLISRQRIISAASGHKLCGHKYKTLFQNIPPQDIFSFTPLYGSMPSAQIFDIAAALLAQTKEVLSRPFVSVKMDRSDSAALINLT